MNVVNNIKAINREQFQKAVTNRFSNTDSGFGNMTQRELILLQIASNIYHEQINDLNTDSVKVEEQDICSCKKDRT